VIGQSETRDIIHCSFISILRMIESDFLLKS